MLPVRSLAVLCPAALLAGTLAAAAEPVETEPLRSRIDPAALERLLERAREERSSAVVILEDGKTVVEEYFGNRPAPLYAMSATKSVVVLALLRLLEHGRLESLDTPVASWFPDWPDGPKRRITVRHLLNHTSGLGRQRGMDRDFADHVRDADLAFEPGSGFLYSNSAVDLLGVVIERLAGESLQRYMQRRFFTPLGIEDAMFRTNPAGQALAAGELRIRPADLARLGQLVLNEGVWDGRRILGRDYLRLAFEPSQEFNPTAGLLWWREVPYDIRLTEAGLRAWSEAGAPPSLVESLRPLAGVPFDEPEVLLREITAVAGESARDDITKVARENPGLVPFELTETGPARGFSARGWLGQYLVVVPESRIVAVRMRRKVPADNEREPRHHYPDFARDVIDLVPVAPR